MTSRQGGILGGLTESLLRAFMGLEGKGLVGRVSAVHFLDYLFDSIPVSGSWFTLVVVVYVVLVLNSGIEYTEFVHDLYDSVYCIYKHFICLKFHYIKDGHRDSGHDNS
jgi:hypothetical protein